MNDSYQKEIPRARINITLDIETGGSRKKKELPLKFLVLGDFTACSSSRPLYLQERISINRHNFDQVLSELNPVLMLKNDISENLPINLSFKQFKDFHPDHIVTQVPELRKLTAMRNLLKEFKSALTDNIALRKALEKLIAHKDNLIQLQADIKIHAPLNQEGPL